MRLMFECIPSPAWLVSKNRCVLASNKAAEEIFKTKTDGY
ncbi:MAG: hypothetical protein PWQ37_394 [Candidatus Petromonas sp.]|jgi:hypothetical protein|nr:hypothetical protein [Candidatus Petromonas sp.]